MTTRIFCAAILVLLTSLAPAATITVKPGGSIQKAIAKAQNKDTVVITTGTYHERINLMGKNLTLRSADPATSSVVSSAIIDAGGQGPVVTFSGTELPACVLSGLTLTNGSAQSGGAISGHGTHATIQNNHIQGNHATNGGGIADCDGFVQNNIISSNTAQTDGGAIYDSDGTVQNNIITQNKAGQDGGGIANSSGIIQNNIIRQNSARQGGALAACDGRTRSNTIYANRASVRGGGIFDCDGPTSTIRNSILWANAAPEGAQVSNSETPSYSCIQNWGNSGVRNIDSDPLFANPKTNNLHLKPESPAIDAGTDMGELIGTSEDMRVVFVGGGYEKKTVHFDTYLASWSAYKDLPKGSPLKLDVISCSVTLGEVMLGESKELQINTLYVGPYGQTGLKADAVTTGVVAQFTVQADSSSTSPLELHMGLNCAGRTDSTTSHIAPGATQTVSARLHGSFTPKQLGDAKAFIYSRTEIGPYEMVGDASERLKFTLKGAQMTVYHEQTGTGSLRDYEGDARPFNGSTARRGDGSDFDMGADEFDGTNYLPDLVPQSLSWSTAGFNDSQSTRVTLQIKNKGNAVSTTSTYTVSADGFGKIRAIAPPIGAGETITRKDLSLGRLTSGTHTVTARVDVNNTQKESSESNNSLDKLLTIAANLPDLHPDDLVFASSSYNASQTAFMNLVVNNEGVAASPSCKYTVSIDGISKTTGTLPSISAATSRTIASISLGKLAAGSRQISVVTDSAKTVRESVEDNNSITESIHVSQPFTDLVVQAFSLPSTITTVRNVTGDVIFRNIGDIASSTCLYTIAVDGIDTISATLPALAPLQSWTAQGISVGQLSVGNHSILASADSTGIVEESSESNNSLARSIVVMAPLPDLRVQGIFDQWSEISASNTVSSTATVTIVNDGDAVSAPCVCSIYINGAIAGTFSVPPLGAATQNTMPRTNKMRVPVNDLPVGATYSVTVFVDSDHNVSEGDENNNSFYKEFGFRENRAEPEWNAYK